MVSKRKSDTTEKPNCAVFSIITDVLYFDFNLNTAGEFELHQSVDSLSC
jgi:hypothetical protein